MANDQDGDQKKIQAGLIKFEERILFLQFIKQGYKGKPCEEREVVTEEHAPRKTI